MKDFKLNPNDQACKFIRENGLQGLTRNKYNFIHGFFELNSFGFVSSELLFKMFIYKKANGN